MSTWKKYFISITLLVILLAATAASPAFMEKPEPLAGGGAWPKSVCFLYCIDGFQCVHAQWDIYQFGTFIDNWDLTGTWDLSGGVFTVVYEGSGTTYSGPVNGRAVGGPRVGDPAGAFSAVYNPLGCFNVVPAPELGMPSPDGS